MFMIPLEAKDASQNIEFNFLIYFLWSVATYADKLTATAS